MSRFLWFTVYNYRKQQTTGW